MKYDAPAKQETIEPLVFEECQHCKKSGWLKVCLVQWEDEKGYRRTSVYNHHSEGQFNYLIENGNFTATADVLPCICSNGDRVNRKNDSEWIPQGQRNKLLKCAFRYTDPAVEDFEQVATVNYLNAIAKGEDNPTKAKFNDFPKDIDKVKEMLRKILNEYSHESP